MNHSECIDGVGVEWWGSVNEASSRDGSQHRISGLARDKLKLVEGGFLRCKHA